jgi:hypothetical protein
MNSIAIYGGLDNLRPTGSMQVLTVQDSVVVLGAFPSGASHVLIQVEDGPLRFRSDGTDPAVDLGYVVEDGATMTWTKEMAAATKWIRDGATNGTVKAQGMRAV